MALASVAAGANGVMLEVHPDPRNSAIDPLQPINFKEFRKLTIEMKKISKIVTR
jgi:3-deoxy-7-phosphoheptulonate synthase